MESRLTFRCPACNEALEPRLIRRILLDCPQCEETIHVKRWFQLTSAVIRAVLFLAIVAGSVKLRVHDWPFWQLCAACFGVLLTV
jgi:hypothetical protein